MKDFLNEKITITSDASIFQTIKKIDNNKLRFAIVVDDNYDVLGVVTDGDIRRQLLSGDSLESKVCFKDKFYFLDYNDDFPRVCELFRDSSVDFLPILNSGKLHNILTKHQFNAMLLEGISYKPNINFSNFNSVSIEHEIYNRPWGYYKSVWLNSNGQAKILSINANSELSLQKHRRREEHWIVTKGTGLARIGGSLIDLYPGKYISVPKECKHQIINNSRSQLFVSEVQLGDYFGEDDIIRYSDKYGRTNKGV